MKKAVMKKSGKRENKVAGASSSRRNVAEMRELGGSDTKSWREQDAPATMGGVQNVNG